MICVSRCMLWVFSSRTHGKLRADERTKLINRIEAALTAMNELFSALLDISKLDGGATTVNVTVFPMAQLLAHAETTFAGAALEKGLSFRVLPSDAWVRSDFILLEQAVFNLINNALRYTRHGRVLVGCRKRGNDLRIEVWDTGIGIAADQHDKIFGEFYRLGEPDRDRRGGLGLGLAIVDRVCRCSITRSRSSPRWAGARPLPSPCRPRRPTKRPSRFRWSGGLSQACRATCSFW